MKNEWPLLESCAYGAIYRDPEQPESLLSYPQRKWMDNRLGQWKWGGTFTPLDLKQAKLTNCHTVVLVSVEIEIDPDVNDEFFP